MKLGCDPEIFLVDAAGALRSSIGLIGGTKAQPSPLPMLGDGYAVQEDNVAIEFNTPAADSREVWSNQIEATIKFLKQELHMMYGFDFSRQSAAIFPEKELAHPMAMMFGCDPDYDAWTGKTNPKPKAADWRLRSCGGHIHIGETFKDDHEKMKMGRLMDLFAAVPSVLMDSGEMRKELYGKRGAIRYKPYGLEYRTLSNFWIFEEKTRLWAWDVTQQAMAALRQGLDVDSEDSAIFEAINNNNKHIAEDLVNRYNLQVV